MIEFIIPFSKKQIISSQTKNEIINKLINITDLNNNLFNRCNKSYFGKIDNNIFKIKHYYSFSFNSINIKGSIIESSSKVIINLKFWTNIIQFIIYIIFLFILILSLIISIISGFLIKNLLQLYNFIFIFIIIWIMFIGRFLWIFLDEYKYLKKILN